MKLAIEGHSTQGSEVIAWLKMLGGMNTFNLNGSETNCYYYIDDNDNIYHCLGIDPRKYIYYTLEEFLEKFPYKVGDKVIDTKTDRVVEIYKAHWSETNNRTYYYVKCFDDTGYIRSYKFLKPYKEETIEESIDKTNKVIFDTPAQSCDIMNAIIKETMEEMDIIKPTTEINLNHPCFDEHNEIELIIPNGWKFEQRGNKMFGIRKQYPKTFIEVLNFWYPDRQIEDDYQRCYKKDLIEKFQDLLYARDAYWKIAGEEMGFDKPWEPDWANANERKYCIVNTEGNITKWVQKTTNKILAFPTEEMRDAFYENFKELIEQCKELL